MQLAIEYILCYSVAFGAGFIIGVGTILLLQINDRRRQTIIDKRVKQIRRDNGRKNYGR